MAMLAYETALDDWKISLRSSDRADVSRIAGKLGGGGHAKASGCSLKGTREEIAGRLIGLIREELEIGGQTNAHE